MNTVLTLTVIAYVAITLWAAWRAVALSRLLYKVRGELADLRLGQSSIVFHLHEHLDWHHARDHVNHAQRLRAAFPELDLVDSDRIAAVRRLEGRL